MSISPLGGSRSWSLCLALGWLAVVTFAGAFAPLLANEQPIWVVGADGRGSFPALASLTPLDAFALVGASCALATLLAAGWHRDGSKLRRQATVILAGLATGLLVLGIATPILDMSERRDPAQWVVAWRMRAAFVPELALAATLLGVAAAGIIVAITKGRFRWGVAVAVGGVLAGAALWIYGGSARPYATPQSRSSGITLWAPIQHSPMGDRSPAAQRSRAAPGTNPALPLAESIVAGRPLTTTTLREMASTLAASSLDGSQQRVLGAVLAELIGEGKSVPSEEILRRYAAEEFVRPPAVVAFVERAWRGELTVADLRDALASVASSKDLQPAEQAAAAEVLSSLIGGSPENLRENGTALAARIAKAIGPPSQLGTDGSGRDVAAQMVHGARTAVGVGVLAVALALMIGIPIGALMGSRGGWIDLLGMRLIEVFRSIPNLLLLIVAASVLPRSGVSLVVVMALCMWPGTAKFVRAEFLRIRELDYVAAARAAGVGEFSIVARHMLPGALGPVIVNASFAVGAAILAESTLSYLGLGPSGVASWGPLLAQAIDSSHRFYWWLALPPGLAIFLTVYALHVLGDYARERIDPRMAV